MVIYLKCCVFNKTSASHLQYLAEHLMGTLPEKILQYGTGFSFYKVTIPIRFKEFFQLEYRDAQIKGLGI